MFSDQAVVVWRITVGMVNADSHDSIFGSDRLSLRFKEVTDANQYFYPYDPQRFSKICKVAMLKSAIFFPFPIWNFGLNMFMTPIAVSKVLLL